MINLSSKNKEKIIKNALKNNVELQNILLKEYFDKINNNCLKFDSFSNLIDNLENDLNNLDLTKYYLLNSIKEILLKYGFIEFNKGISKIAFYNQQFNKVLLLSYNKLGYNSNNNLYINLNHSSFLDYDYLLNFNRFNIITCDYIKKLDKKEFKKQFLKEFKITFKEFKNLILELNEYYESAYLHNYYKNLDEFESNFYKKYENNDNFINLFEFIDFYIFDVLKGHGLRLDPNIENFTFYNANLLCFDYGNFIKDSYNLNRKDILR